VTSLVPISCNFTRLIPNHHPNVISQKIDLPLLSKPNLHQQDLVLPETFADFALKQCNEYAPKFGFSFTSDSIYRYFQGALVNWSNECKIDVEVRLIFPTFGVHPEGGHKISDISFVAKTQPGVLLENSGMPVKIKLRPNTKFDPKLENLSIGLR